VTRPGQAPGPDGFDADLSVTRAAVDDIGVWRAIWDARREPDAFARRCAADAIDAIDTALAALHRIRAEWVSQVRQADDAAAARADQLLARMREGPPGAAAARPLETGPPPPMPTRHPPKGGQVVHSISRAVDSGQAPREAAP
jgi:hypothetical protein